MKILQPLLLLVCHDLSPSRLMVQAFNQALYDQIVLKLEGDVLQYRDEIERYYVDYRCDENQLDACPGQNINECRSAMPNPTCPSGSTFALNACGDSSQGCGGFFDFTKSVYSTPPSADASDRALVEDVCYTRFMDDYLVEKRSLDAGFWRDLVVEPRAQYFGSHNGMFRIHPGRNVGRCAYDPRVRPWYVAGSSGPKNIVMVLDKSGSMQGPRLALLKEAALRVIESLTARDRVALVFFDEVATVVADEGKYLFSATKENKEILHQEVQDLEARRQTNFYGAFEAAFDILDDSVANELYAPCNSAILFLTDGLMTHPSNADPADVIHLIDQRTTNTSQAIGKPVILFTYSVSEEDDVHELPKQIACSTEIGTWSRIDRDDKIVEALSTYYLLFALGVGSDKNADFTAWAPPYVFSSSNLLGTTVSAPVYDRSKSPALFIGVVGIDILLEPLNQVLGTDDSTQLIEHLSRKNVARCPDLSSLTSCQVESYRTATRGEEARCGDIACSRDDDVETTAGPCAILGSRYPTGLDANVDQEGISYTDKICCVNPDFLSVNGDTDRNSGQCAVDQQDEEEQSVSTNPTNDATDGVSDNPEDDECNDHLCQPWFWAIVILGPVCVLIVALVTSAIKYNNLSAGDGNSQVGSAAATEAHAVPTTVNPNDLPVADVSSGNDAENGPKLDNNGDLHFSSNDRRPRH